MHLILHFMENIGSRLRKLREMKRLSQEYIADCLHVSSSTISRIENNCMTAKLEQVRDYCEVLGVSMETLFAKNARYKAAPLKISLNIELENIQVLNEVYSNLYKIIDKYNK